MSNERHERLQRRQLFLLTLADMTLTPAPHTSKSLIQDLQAGMISRTISMIRQAAFSDTARCHLIHYLSHMTVITHIYTCRTDTDTPSCQSTSPTHTAANNARCLVLSSAVTLPLLIAGGVIMDDGDTGGQQVG